MTRFERAIAFGFCLYAFMLTQVSTTQGTAAYILQTWGSEAVWGFVIWFIISAIGLIWLSFTSPKSELAMFFFLILPQIAYTLTAIVYVISDRLISGGNAQIGAITTHGFGSILLLTIIYHFYRLYLGEDNGRSTGGVGEAG